MSATEILSKSKPVIIIILLFLAAFLLRADAVNINGVTPQYKSMFEDQNGLPYFSELDSYYNYRMTQDYLDHGYVGDTIKNGTPWDLHSYYPPGASAGTPLIAVITAFVYKLVNSFANVPLNEVCIWVAPFIASLAVIPAYLFVRRITNDYGGITAGLLVGLAPAYFAHTFAGFFDTDQFNMLFPILIVGFFIVSILAKDIKTRSIYVTLSAISLLVYSMAWEGWWYVFYLLVGTGIVYLLVSNYLFKMETIKPFKEYPDKIKWFLDQPALFSLIVFAVVSSILLSIYLGPSGFVNALTSAIGATKLQAAVQSTAYPNVFVSVGELAIPSWSDVIKAVGGIGYGPSTLLFFGALIPLVFGILVVPWLLWELKPEETKGNTKNENKPKRKSKPRRRAKRAKTEVIEEKVEKKNTPIIDPQVMENKRNYLLYATLFAIWLLLTAYMVTKGSRFIEQFALPIELGAGVFVGLMAPYFAKNIKNARYCTIAMLVLIVLAVGSPVYSAYAASNSVVPGADDSMYNSMLWVKNNTPQNTVLTSWWDFGHLFTAVADRPVTFDGAHQNNGRAYWVGKALLTNNEDLSAGILRMLTSSGDQGYLTLENYTHDTGKSVEILDQILPVDKQTAQTILTTNYKLTPEQAQNVLQYTHPDNPAPHELILSSDMLGKALWWSYFGSWNFTTNQGQHYVYSAAPAYTKQVNGTTVLQAQNGVVAQINGTSIVAGVQYEQSNQTQILAPYKLIVVQNGTVKMNQLVSNESSFNIMLISENNGVIAVLMNKELENSMFTKMYLLNGTGLTRFKLVHAEGGILDPWGTTVWNVN